MSFQNKVVIVTGASSGIGATTAKMFAKEKAKVVIVGRNIDRLNKVEEDIKKTTGVEVLAIKADMSNEEEARGVIDKTIARFKQLDVLINNAGFAISTTILDKDFINKFDTVLNTNLRGVAVITHAAAPHLIKSKGNIVNISSVASYVAIPTFSVYGTSKAGLDHLSRCLAVELAEHGVRVNVINPGPVATEFATNTGLAKEGTDKYYENRANTTPLKRVCQGDEVGDLILYLASDKARSVTGSSYTIDCGIALVNGFSNNKK